MGIYSDPKLVELVCQRNIPKYVKTKLDMGKSCIRGLRKLETIPYELLGELCSKMTVEDWITTYENAVKR